MTLREVSYMSRSRRANKVIRMTMTLKQMNGQEHGLKKRTTKGPKNKPQWVTSPRSKVANVNITS